MSKSLALIVGISLGCLYGTILWAALLTLGLPSFILYGNRYYVPIATANTVGAVSLFVVLSSGIWLPWTMDLVDKYGRKGEE